MTDAQHSKLLNKLSETGMPRTQAVALVAAIGHALECPEYARQFGTYLQGHLQAFVEQAVA